LRKFNIYHHSATVLKLLTEKSFGVPPRHLVMRKKDWEPRVVETRRLTATRTHCTAFVGDT